MEAHACQPDRAAVGVVFDAVGRLARAPKNTSVLGCRVTGSHPSIRDPRISPSPKDSRMDGGKGVLADNFAVPLDSKSLNLRDLGVPAGEEMSGPVGGVIPTFQRGLKDGLVECPLQHVDFLFRVSGTSPVPLFKPELGEDLCRVNIPTAEFLIGLSEVKIKGARAPVCPTSSLMDL